MIQTGWKPGAINGHTVLRARSASAGLFLMAFCLATYAPTFRRNRVAAYSPVPGAEGSWCVTQKCRHREIAAMGSHNTPAEQAQPPPVYGDRNFRVIVLVTLVAVLGVSSVTPAFPSLADDLAISSASTGLLVSAFTVPGIVLTPLLGLAADRWGRKTVLVPSLLLFGLAGGACAVAPTFQALVILRGVQGIGAASLGSLNLTLIGDFFEGNRRASAMGCNAAALSIGTASYPMIGGALALLGWRYPFALALVGVVVGLVCLAYLDTVMSEERPRFGDYIREIWSCINKTRALALFGLTLATFVLLYGAYLTYVPFLVENQHGGSAVTTGLIMSVMSLTTAIVSSQVGRLTERWGERALLRVAFIPYAAGLLIMVLAPHIWLLLIAAATFGVGHGLNLPCVQTLLAGIAPTEQRGAFMSVNGMIIRLGQTLGPLIAGGAYAFGGLPAVFYSGSAIAVAMVLGTWAALRN